MDGFYITDRQHGCCLFYFLASLIKKTLSLSSELSHSHNSSAACRFRKRTLEIHPSQDGRWLCAELTWKCILFGALPVHRKIRPRVPVYVCGVCVRHSAGSSQALAQQRELSCRKHHQQRRKHSGVVFTPRLLLA